MSFSKFFFLVLFFLLLTACSMNRAVLGSLVGGGVGMGVGALTGFFVAEHVCDGGCSPNLSDEASGALVGGISGGVLFATTGAVVGNYFESQLSEQRKLHNLAVKRERDLDFEVQALFFSACRLGDTKVVIKALEADPRFIYLVDGSEKTGLHWAAELGQDEVAQLLVYEGISLDEQDDEGRTALHYAILNKHVVISEMLIEEGSNLDILDDKGKSPIDYLRENYINQSIDLLLEKDREILDSSQSADIFKIE